MKIGVLSDTHVPSRTPSLAPRVYELFQDERVEAILHAGDIETMDVIVELETLAPVFAVRGNMDGRPDVARLPLKRVETFEGIRVGLIHGSGGRDVARRAMKEFTGQSIDILVYGHTHNPADETIMGVRTLNPGSATTNYFRLRPTAGILDIGSSVNFRIVEL